jgi:hypothetical protein
MTLVLATETERIERWVRHPISVRTLIHWPYLNEVFRADIRDQIERVVQEGPHSPSVPWKVRFSADKYYYYPGSLKDYILFVLAVLRCRSAIALAKKNVSSLIDFGPPGSTEIAEGNPGDARFLSQYWLPFTNYVNQNAIANGVIVHADVRRFFSCVNPEILANRLLEHHASRDDVNRLMNMFNFWKTHDSPGLPFLYASWPLSHMYLTTVDTELKKAWG